MHFYADISEVIWKDNNIFAKLLLDNDGAVKELHIIREDLCPGGGERLNEGKTFLVDRKSVTDW